MPLPGQRWKAFRASACARRAVLRLPVFIVLVDGKHCVTRRGEKQSHVPDPARSI